MLITGGSRGIGRAVVDALLRRHWTVALCSKSQQSVDQAVRAHFSEGDAARLAYLAATVEEREALILFLEDL